MKKSTVAVCTASAAAFHIGLSYLTFREIFARNANIPGWINEASKKRAKKKNPAAAGKKDERVEWMHAQKFTEYSLVNERGQILKAFYLEASEKTDRFVLCSHGYRNQGKGEFRFITKFYHDNGYNVLLVDHVAEGESEGKYMSFGRFESVDLKLWIQFLLDRFGSDIEILLHGISMGSATVLMLAGNEQLPENVKFIVSDCGFSNLHELFEDVLKVPVGVSFPLMKTVDIFNKIAQGFSYYDISPIDAVKKIRIPVLFVHGVADGFIPVKMAKDMYNVCPGDKDILLVEHAGHISSYRKNSEDYEKKILEFSSKYVRNYAEEK